MPWPEYSWRPGPRHNIRTVFPSYGDFHVKDKTVAFYIYFETPPWINSMTSDVMAAWIAWSSSAMLLTINRSLSELMREDFLLSMPYQHREMTDNANVYKCYLRKSTHKSTTPNIHVACSFLTVKQNLTSVVPAMVLVLVPFGLMVTTAHQRPLTSTAVLIGPGEVTTVATVKMLQSLADPMWMVVCSTRPVAVLLITGLVHSN